MKGFEDMRLLVTGGAGFIGSNFVHHALVDNSNQIDEITVFDKLTYSGTVNNLARVKNEIRFVKGDICDFDLIQKLVAENDVVINFAAESHVDRSIQSSSEFVQTNFMGVHSLLEALKMSKEKIMIQISTDEVYGSISEGSWTEEYPLRPNSPYSASKASADLLCRSYVVTHGLDVRITRCSNNYGPYQYPEKIIPLFITNILQNKKLPIYGNGKNIRDWLHVEDHCRGILLTLKNGKRGEIYNIGGGKELTNIQLASVILDFFEKDDSFIVYVNDRQGHDFRYSLNYTKAKVQLGYEPKIKFSDGIENTIKWYLNNTDFWEPLVNRIVNQTK